MKTVGERIRERRIELGWSQQELAERMDLKSKTSVSRVENGIEDVTVTRIKEYAKALGVIPEYLVRNEEKAKDFGLTDEEKKMIEKFRQIDGISRKNVIGLIDIAYEDYLSRKKDTTA